MNAPTRCLLPLTLAALTSVLFSADAVARPPTTAAANGQRLTPAAPLIGRVLVRGQIIDLTRASIAAGGPAHDLAQGTARVIADAEVTVRQRHDDDTSRPTATAR